jgi:LemA protein
LGRTRFLLIFMREKNFAGGQHQPRRLVRRPAPGWGLRAGVGGLLFPTMLAQASTLSVLTVVLLVAAGIAVLVVLWAIGLYNSLVRGRNGYRNAFAQIDVQLKRRHDLIPNLVETAKAYLKHERETLEAVIAARNSAETARAAAAANPSNAGAMATLGQAESGLGGMLGRLFAVAEAYPDLKANQTMMQLSEELTTTENKVAFARQAYNDSVMRFNNQRETFPSNLVAAPLGFVPAVPFEVSGPAEREAVKVTF